jgi:hypothetical protein
MAYLLLLMSGVVFILFCRQKDLVFEVQIRFAIDVCYLYKDLHRRLVFNCYVQEVLYNRIVNILMYFIVFAQQMCNVYYQCC